MCSTVKKMDTSKSRYREEVRLEVHSQAITTKKKMGSSVAKTNSTMAKALQQQTLQQVQNWGLLQWGIFRGGTRELSRERQMETGQRPYIGSGEEKKKEIWQRRGAEAWKRLEWTDGLRNVKEKDSGVPFWGKNVIVMVVTGLQDWCCVPAFKQHPAGVPDPQGVPLFHQGRLLSLQLQHSFNRWALPKKSNWTRPLFGDFSPLQGSKHFSKYLQWP